MSVINSIEALAAFLPMVRHLALCIVVLGASTACERPSAPVNGIGGFELGKSKLGGVQRAANARCFDTDGKAKCLILARQSIAKRSLEIPGCNLDEVGQWFENRLGDPSRKIDQGVLWQQKYMVLSLYISGPSRCQVIALDPDDESGVQELVKPYASNPATPEPR